MVSTEVCECGENVLWDNGYHLYCKKCLKPYDYEGNPMNPYEPDDHEREEENRELSEM